MDKVVVNYHHINHRSDQPLASGVTLRTEINQETETIKVSWAICNPKDSYDRREGRARSFIKAHNGTYLEGQYIRALPLKENAILHMASELKRRVNPKLPDYHREIEIALERIGTVEYLNAIDNSIVNGGDVDY